MQRGPRIRTIIIICRNPNKISRGMRRSELRRGTTGLSDGLRGHSLAEGRPPPRPASRPRAPCAPPVLRPCPPPLDVLHPPRDVRERRPFARNKGSISRPTRFPSPCRVPALLRTIRSKLTRDDRNATNASAGKSNRPTPASSPVYFHLALLPLIGFP